jgi:hypothetical protein
VSDFSIVCPCGKPATLRTWESDLFLCRAHGRDWLRSHEKEIAGVAVIEKNDDALRGAVETFVVKIARRPGVIERLRGAVSALLGRQA